MDQQKLPSWKRISRRSLIDTQYMQVSEDSIELPDGAIIDDYTVVSMPSGVVIVATDTEGRLLTQYEYKYAINKTILNLPSGSVEKGVSILETAANELLEETGYVSDELELIQTLYEYPSKADHTIHIIRAKNARKVTGVTHEFTETIGPVQLLTLGVNSQDYVGKFNATYTVAALALTLPGYLKA